MHIFDPHERANGFIVSRIHALKNAEVTLFNQNDELKNIFASMPAFAVLFISIVSPKVLCTFVEDFMYVPKIKWSLFQFHNPKHTRAIILLITKPLCYWLSVSKD